MFFFFFVFPLSNTFEKYNIFNIAVYLITDCNTSTFEQENFLKSHLEHFIKQNNEIHSHVFYPLTQALRHFNMGEIAKRSETKRN